MKLKNIRQSKIRKEFEIPVRMRYCETDQMGVVHHANYFRYFELARMEQFRSWGCSYGAMEESGIFLMIIDMKCKCRAPAFFDEVISVKTWVERMTRFRIFHGYEVKKEDDRMVAYGKTVLTSVDREGLPVPLPQTLQEA